MALITKTFWKWDSQYNNTPFAIGELVSSRTLEEVFDLETKEDNKSYWQKKDNSNIKIITYSSRIIQKSYARGGQVGQILIERDFQGAVESHIRKYLPPSSQYAQETKLILGYIDAILSAAILVYH